VPLEHLFDAELQYRQDLEPLVSSDEREGELIGSGDGTVSGVKVAGRLRWSMFAADCVFRFDGVATNNNGDHVCTTNPALVLETEDGARIWIDAKGYGLRRASAAPNWRLTASLRFQTDDPRYRWLDNAFGIWEGVFDEDARHARYRAFLQTIEPAVAA
jgi:Protein of unknown function (DUF3237)